MIGLVVQPFAEFPLSSVEAALAVFVLVTALVTAFLRDIVAVIVVFAAYSLGMALFYALLLAPDVAMTEAAVGAGVTTLLLLLTVAKTTHPRTERRFDRVNLPAAGLVGGFFLVVVATVGAIPPVGAESAWAWAAPVSQYYPANAVADTGVTNAVTAVLAGYRGFDTFGEAIVVFAAGVAVLLVLRLEVFTSE